jgi:hypothetical protein
MTDFLTREDLGGELLARHDELMSSDVGSWPPDLRMFVQIGPALHCGQALADRVAAWLAEGRDSE